MAIARRIINRVFAIFSDRLTSCSYQTDIYKQKKGISIFNVKTIMELKLNETFKRLQSFLKIPLKLYAVIKSMYLSLNNEIMIEK